MLADQNGKCWECGCELRAGMFHADHRQALEHGGDNEPDNVKLICVPCHRIKTRKDNAARAKCDRIRAGGRERKGPPMAGARDSKWKRKLNGETIRR